MCNDNKAINVSYTDFFSRSKIFSYSGGFLDSIFSSVAKSQFFRSFLLYYDSSFALNNSYIDLYISISATML